MSENRYQRVSELFQQAVECAEDKRAAFLDQACAGDVDLRAEVESLLACDSPEPRNAAQSIPGIALDALRDAFADEAVDMDDDALPPKIGRYRPIRLIARGGMGIVYEAEQDQPHRRVALKILASHAVSGQMLRRFRQEAEILGRLKHPGIAQIFDMGRLDRKEGGQAYLVMELVDGRPLTTYAAAADLDTRQRLELFASICDAIHHAHQKGIIHRDLKPDNILITPDGSPKILDFGIARVTNADLKVTTIQTHAGQLMGTITYMSPEQVSCNLEELDVRSDIYALGVVLFELLAGRLPHDLIGRSIPDIVRVIQEVEPQRLSSINTVFRGDVDVIVAKALEKDASRRYASAAEMAADIRRHLKDEPITAHPPSSMYQLQKFTRRNRGLVLGVAVIFVLLVSGIIATSRQAAVASRQRERAERRLNEVRTLTRTLIFEFDELLRPLAGATPAREFL
ncbi:MAG: serine/threonine-protein kinase, partial [Planctomycetota bacterium]|nr:serine/threonine-protein kinase [Planctomycetota bacterium]